MDKPVHTNPSGHKENLRLRRPERPGRAPGRCVRLRSPRKVPTAPLESGPGPERRRERRRRREQPTSGAAHPELLPGPLPPTSASRDVAALPARRPPRHGPPRRGHRGVRGIPPRGQVVPGLPRLCLLVAGENRRWPVRKALPCSRRRLRAAGAAPGPLPGFQRLRNAPRDLSSFPPLPLRGPDKHRA